MSRRVETTGGRVTVEVEDLHKEQYGEAAIVERFYEHVDVLDSGWLRCFAPDEARGADDGRECIDYYPPERVNMVSGIQEVDGE